MQTALENLSKEDLLKVISSRDEALAERDLQISELVEGSSRKDEKIDYLTRERDRLKHQVEMLRRMQFGQKRERFEGDPGQTVLPFEAGSEAVEQQQEEVNQKIEYVRKRPNHKGRAKLPEHLPVEEIEIHPESDLSDMVCIGREITEELECEPAKFYIKRYIRYKYAAKGGEGVKIGGLPDRVIDKGIPGAGLLAMILTGKYMDHLPLYRQKQIFARENIQIASSTIEGWTKEALIKLEPLYEQLVFDTKTKGYLQVDETVIKVLDSDKKGAATKVGIGCTMPRSTVLCCSTTSPRAGRWPQRSCWIPSRATCRPMGMPSMGNMAAERTSPTWPAGPMRGGNSSVHWIMTGPGPKRR